MLFDVIFRILGILGFFLKVFLGFFFVFFLSVRLFLVLRILKFLIFLIFAVKCFIISLIVFRICILGITVRGSIFLRHKIILERIVKIRLFGVNRLILIFRLVFLHPIVICKIIVQIVRKIRLIFLRLSIGIFIGAVILRLIIQIIRQHVNFLSIILSENAELLLVLLFLFILKLFVLFLLRFFALKFKAVFVRAFCAYARHKLRYLFCFLALNPRLLCLILKTEA